MGLKFLFKEKEKEEQEKQLGKKSYQIEKKEMTLQKKARWTKPQFFGAVVAPRLASISSTLRLLPLPENRYLAHLLRLPLPLLLPPHFASS